MAPQWITNCPEAAKLLRAADNAYYAARAAARHLPLAEKIAAYRAAKRQREAAYAAVHAEAEAPPCS